MTINLKLRVEITKKFSSMGFLGTTNRFVTFTMIMTNIFEEITSIKVLINTRKFPPTPVEFGNCYGYTTTFEILSILI